MSHPSLKTIAALGIAGIIAGTPMVLAKETPKEPDLCKLITLSDKTIQARYLFATENGVTYNERHMVKGEPVIAQYTLSDEAIQIPNGRVLPGTKNPTSYIFRGKVYIDSTADGLNCNEKLYNPDDKQS